MQSSDLRQIITHESAVDGGETSIGLDGRSDLTGPLLKPSGGEREIDIGRIEFDRFLNGERGFLEFTVGFTQHGQQLPSGRASRLL